MNRRKEASAMLSRTKLALLLISGLSITAAPSMAGKVPFTWNLSEFGGDTFTADSMSMTTFLYNLAPPGGNAAESFILTIDGFTKNGVNFTPAGLGSVYGLYLYGDVTVTPANVYTKINISLWADPGNNDGTPSSSLAGGLAFANTGPTGAADDIELATGTIISGSFGLQSNGRFGAHFVETFRPVPDQASVFVSPIGPYVSIEEFLFNTATSRESGTLPDGYTWVTVNNGFSNADLRVPEPASLAVLASGLVGLVLTRRRRVG